jgi:hypothetical protein
MKCNQKEKGHRMKASHEEREAQNEINKLIERIQSLDQVGMVLLDVGWVE